MSKYIQNTDTIILGLFMTSLSIYGNYMGDTMNCNTKHILDNKYFKYIIMAIIINFTISYTNINNHPVNHLIHTLILFMVFIIIQKLDYIYYAAVWFLIFISMILIQYKNYNESNDNIDMVEKTNKIDYIVKIIIIIIVVIGYINYIVNYNYKNFNLFDFLLKNNC